jgi:hypothetical protein
VSIGQYPALNLKHEEALNIIRLFDVTLPMTIRRYNILYIYNNLKIFVNFEIFPKIEINQINYLKILLLQYGVHQ